MLPGNTLDQTTLGDFLARIEKAYGKAFRLHLGHGSGNTYPRRFWPRSSSDPPIDYLVKYAALVAGQVRAIVAAKAVAESACRYRRLRERGRNWSRSKERLHKEKGMRLRGLRRLLERLKKLRDSKRRYQRDTILIKLGEAKKEAGPRIWRLLDILP